MAATPSLLIKYTVPDRGTTKLVTNRYHFAGGTPADATAWGALADAVVAEFHPAISNHCEIVEAVGYAAASDVAVFSKPYAQAGTFAPGGDTDAGLPGFCCALVRWATDQRTTKNHPIYLFSYIHGVCGKGGSVTPHVLIDDVQFAAIEAFAQQWWNAGFSDGTNTYHRAGPNGAVAQSRVVDQYVTDHDLSPR